MVENMNMVAAGRMSAMAVLEDLIALRTNELGKLFSFARMMKQVQLPPEAEEFLWRLLVSYPR